MTKPALKIDWRCAEFDVLTAAELYEILKLRSEVFVVEQNCVYLDCDGLDKKAWHLSAWLGNELVAYSRLLGPGVAYQHNASIGRVVVSPRHRKTGMGVLLMKESLRHLRMKFGDTPVTIAAQQYLLGFYAALGFHASGPVYDEDGIPHVPMSLNPSGT